MDLEKIEFLPDDFEFVGDKQDITKDVVAPSLPAWKDSLNRFKKNKGAVIGLVCILIIAVFVIVKLVGGVSFGGKSEKTTAQTTQANATTASSEKVSVPNVVGKTEDEAKIGRAHV